MLKLLKRWSCLITVGFSLHQVPGDVFPLTTTNKTQLNRFFDTAENRTRPITIVSFGDSMADSYRSITFSLMNRFADKLGVAGYSLNNYRNTLMWNLNGGAALLQPSSYWFTDHLQLPAGSSIFWETQYSPGGIMSDRAGIFWVAQPSGGQFTLSISTNTGAWSQQLTLDGYSAIPVGRYTNLVLALDYHRLRVDGQTGTNLIIGPQLLNSQTNGLQAVFMDKGGIYLGNVTNVSRLIRDPIMQALAPDLLIWHMKEDGTEGTRQRMQESEQWWAATAPQADVIYIGTPYTLYDQEASPTVEQNTLTHSIAMEFGRTYMDCMNPSVSYGSLVTNHWIESDGVHLSYDGGLHFGELMWKELGFFAIRTNRRINFQFNQNNLQIGWLTAPNIIYGLESSSNLINWSSVESTIGDGATRTYNVSSPEAARFYRLELKAP